MYGRLTSSVVPTAMAVRQAVVWTVTGCLLTVLIPGCCGQCTSPNRPGLIQLRANEAPVTLTSPGYPYEEYGRNEDCAWQIEILTASASYIVHVYIQDMDLESPSAACRYDYVTLYNGDYRYGTASESDALVRLCSVDYGRHYYSSGRYMHITFNSDHSVQESGFALKVNAVLRSERVETTTPWWRRRDPTTTTTTTSSWFDSEYDSTDVLTIVAVTVGCVILVSVTIPILICLYSQRRAQRLRQARTSQFPAGTVLLGPPPRSPGAPSAPTAPPLEGGNGGRVAFAGGPPSYLSLSQNDVRGGSPRHSPRNGRAGLNPGYSDRDLGALSASSSGLATSRGGPGHDGFLAPGRSPRASPRSGSPALHGYRFPGSIESLDRPGSRARSRSHSPRPTPAGTPGLPGSRSGSPRRGDGGERSDGEASRADVPPPSDGGEWGGPPAAPPSYDEVMASYPPDPSAPTPS